MKMKLPLPLWVGVKSEVFSSAVDLQGRHCCLLFSSKAAVKAFSESKNELDGAQFRSMNKAEARDFLAVVKTRGISHVVIDHEEPVSLTIAIDDLIEAIGESTTSN
jgi:uroporphyrinogen-III synthase